MTTHSDKRRDKARTIANESGISARQLGWRCAPSSRSVMGYVYIDLFWDEE